MYSNVALSSSKARKFRILGENLPLRNKSHWVIFTKLAVGEGVSGVSFVPNFTIEAFEMWAEVHQNCQNMEFFGYKSAPKGQSSYGFF